MQYLLLIYENEKRFAQGYPPAELADLRKELAAAGYVLPEGQKVDDKLHRLRQMYEPYINVLGQFLLMPLPKWVPHEPATDNWQRLA